MVFVLRTAWLVTRPHIDLYPPPLEVAPREGSGCAGPGGGDGLGEFVDGEVDAGAFVEELGGFLGHRRAAHRPVTPWGRLRSVRTGARPPAEVYDLVSDVPTMASRSDEVADAWWEQRVDEAAVRVGERFTARNQNFGVSWETTSTVTAADPGRRFAYTVGDLADPTARWSFELSGPDEGPTEVLHTAELGPGPRRRPTTVPVADGGHSHGLP